MHLPVGWIVAGDVFAAGHDHLRSTSNCSNDRRHVAARLVLAIDFPIRLAGLAIQRNNIRVAIVVSVDNDRILV